MAELVINYNRAKERNVFGLSHCDLKLANTSTNFKVRVNWMAYNYINVYSDYVVLRDPFIIRAAREQTNGGIFY